MAANDQQVGGDHYKGAKGQEHWDYAWYHQFDFFQYQITKYVERWRKKGGLQDLYKARHFLDKYIELLEPDKSVPDKPEVTVTNPSYADWLQNVKPTGWVLFEFEGADADGWHYRCQKCRKEIRGLKQYQPPWDKHDASKCSALTGVT